MNPWIEALRRGDVAALRAGLKQEPAAARAPEIVIEAARIANESGLRLLLAAGADPNAKKRGYRPLHALLQERLHHEADAPSAERLRCLDVLLEAGADPELTGAYPPARALLVAAFTGVETFVDRLLAAGAARDGFSACALLEVARVKRVLAADAGFPRRRDEGGLAPLQACAASKLFRGSAAKAKAKLAIATLLLDAGADPNEHVKAWSSEVDAAYFAASAHDLALFALLLERGADATSALAPALWSAGEDFAQLALARGGSLDRATSNGKPLLNDLIRWGRLTQALWALEQGASPNVPDAEGWTALHQAASRGALRLVTACLEAGADSTRQDRGGRGALDVARPAQRNAVRELIQTAARKRKGGRLPPEA